MQIKFNSIKQPLKLPGFNEKISWMKDNVSLSSKSKTLIISNFEEKNFGYYTCITSIKNYTVYLGEQLFEDDFSIIEDGIPQYIDLNENYQLICSMFTK